MALRVLAVHERYAQRGGEDEVFDTETRLLEDRGHPVERLVVDNAEIGEGLLGRALAATCGIWNPAAARRTGRLIDRVRPDVVHVHNTFPLLSPAVARAARMRNVPVVMTLHNYRLACVRGDLFRGGGECRRCLEAGHAAAAVRYRCYRDSFAGSLAAASALEIHRRLGLWERSVSTFITPSRMTANLLRARLPTADIVVKPHFLREDPGAGPGGSVALFAGRLTIDKGLDVVLDAWRRHSGLPPLLIAGDGPLRDQQDGETAAPVRWLGRLPRSEVIDLLGRAALVISASPWPETFGLTVIEAFGRGTPAAVPTGTALAELVRSETGRVYEQGNPDALAVAVKQIASQRAQRTMRPAARSAYLAQYTAPRGYERLIGTYRMALDAGEG